MPDRARCTELTAGKSGRPESAMQIVVRAKVLRRYPFRMWAESP